MSGLSKPTSTNDSLMESAGEIFIRGKRGVKVRQ